MFHLNSSLHSGSSWDTSYARTYLRISEDQLEKINQIPGWSKTENSEENTSENDKSVVNAEKQFNHQTLSLQENILTTHTKISTNDNILRTKNSNSNLKSKQTPFLPEKDKEAFLENFSLSPIKKKHTPTHSLSRSCSLPNLCKELLSPRKLEKISPKSISSQEKNISNDQVLPLLAKDISNVTNKAPVLSGDSINPDKLLKTNPKPFPLSCTDVNQLPKETFRPLDDSILSRIYLKGAAKSVSDPIFSKISDKSSLKQDMSILEKKLLLLEKRLSPAKDLSPLSLNTKLLNVENQNLNKNLKSTQSLTPVDEVMTSKHGSKLDENLDDIVSPTLSKGNKSVELQSNSQSLNEKCDSPNVFESIKDSTETPKTTACNFESFLSPPVPCGQPIATQVPSASQPMLVEKSANLSSSEKFQSVNTSPLSTDVPSLTQLETLQESVKLNTPNELQDSEFSCKTVVPEKSNDAFNVFSANTNDKASESPSSKELGMKRKRRSKTEKSVKKLDMKKVKRTDFQYSSEQIRSMIEIMKLFHTEF